MEADNIAIMGVALKNEARGKNIITSSLEHHAVENSCKKLKFSLVIISWFLLAGALASYLIVFKVYVIDKFLKDLHNNLIEEIHKYDTISLYNKDINTSQINNILEWKWELGFGLIGNCIGLVLLPIINLFLLV